MASRGLYDVAWGPKPRALRWEPIGGSSAARVVWECEVGLVECEDINSAHKERKPITFSTNPDSGAGFLPDEVLQLVYNESWDIDVNGMTTKHYDAILQVRGYIDAGFLQAVFNSDPTAGQDVDVNPFGTPGAQGESADAFRWFFEPALRHGYLRTRKYAINDDKTELRINITDTEVASDWPFPPGVSDMSAEYSISSALMGGNVPGGGGGGFITWDCKLSGSITMTKSWHPYWRRVYPYYIFLLLIRSRYRPALRAGDEPEGVVRPANPAQFAPGGDDVEPLNATGQPFQNLPLSFNLTEDIFGREFSFNFNWMALVNPPSEAPRYLRYGYPPNIFAENQHKVDPDDFLKRGRLVSWDWDLWLRSMIKAGGASDFYWQDWSIGDPIADEQVGDVSGVVFTTEIPTHFLKRTKVAGRVATILSNWTIKAAPMSIHGSDHLRFEGDGRMEPCQDNLDFWYQNAIPTPRQEPFISPGENPISAVFYDHGEDNTNKIIDIQSEMELVEHNSTVAVSPLHNQFNSSPLMGYVDGMSTETDYGSIIPSSGLQSGETSIAGVDPSIGDTNMTYDRVEIKYEGTSDRATKNIALAPPKYQLHVMGKATTMGQPLNPSRCYQYGEALAVKSGTHPTRHSVRQVTHGTVEMWVTKWDLWYDLVGTPNGVAPKPAGETAYGHVGKTGKAPYFAENQTIHSATRRLG